MTELAPIRLSYYLRVKNAGDRLNANIVSAVSKRNTYYVRDKTNPFLLPSGSILGSARKNTWVWGAGLMHPQIGLGAAKPENISLLRGKRSYEALRKSGVQLEDIPLGDPLFLAPKLLGVTRSNVVRHRVGIMAHYADRQTNLIQNLLENADVVDLNVHDDPLVLLKQMATCDHVLSSCLHGIILADALNIPSRWIQTDTKFSGDGFEFSDWFSLCREPQNSAWKLAVGDTLENIISDCQCNMPDITAADILESFPHDQIDHLIETNISKPLISLNECRNAAVPVFVISFNRGRMLQGLVESLKPQNLGTDVIVHDNGSNDPYAIETLDKLSKDGLTVIRRPKISNATELNNIDETITSYFENWAEPQNYIVTDCDISITPCDADFLGVLSDLLDRLHSIGCAGPMLQIHDISKSNPIYNSILTRHIEQFWSKYPHFAKISNKIVAYQPAKIDTTFALHRAGEPFERLKKGVRTYEPYEARHLDWYEEEQEENYRNSSDERISHWGNQAFIDKVKEKGLTYDHFIRVARLDNQSLCVQKVLVDGSATQEIAIHHLALKQSDEKIETLKAKLVAANQRQKQKRIYLRSEIKKLRLRLEAKNIEIEVLQKSASWRLTAPFRKLMYILRR
tara:strand:+ start:1127 stop:3007 length:1881 start_codon:yes stop_codon:yes gene_type:complete